MKKGIKLEQLVYESMEYFLLSTEVQKLTPLLTISTSKNES